MIFGKIWRRRKRVTQQFAERFNTIVEPIKDKLMQYNNEKIRGAKAPTDLSQVIILTQVKPFFGQGLIKDFLVDLAGIEPASESSSIQASPITVIILTFPLSPA